MDTSELNPPLLFLGPVQILEKETLWVPLYACKTVYCFPENFNKKASQLWPIPLSHPFFSSGEAASGGHWNF
jgi:hypothetical protein